MSRSLLLEMRLSQIHPDEPNSHSENYANRINGPSWYADKCYWSFMPSGSMQSGLNQTF
jgi:hypothetical protein